MVNFVPVLGWYFFCELYYKYFNGNSLTFKKTRKLLTLFFPIDRKLKLLIKYTGWFSNDEQVNISKGIGLYFNYFFFYTVTVIS